MCESVHFLSFILNAFGKVASQHLLNFCITEREPEFINIYLSYSLLLLAVYSVSSADLFFPLELDGSVGWSVYKKKRNWSQLITILIELQEIVIICS